MKNILIVDDEPHVLLLLKQFLERHGYGITTAPHGEQALEIVADNQFDALITDAQMPKMDGMKLCEQVIRQYPGINLIIIMTAKTDREIRTWAEERPVKLMEKPLSMRRLVAMLDHFFESKNQAMNGH